MASRKKAGTVLAHRKATVAIHRNGLSIEIQEVPAEDCGVAAKELLDVMRTLTAAYEELVVDAGGVHSQPIDQPEEVDEADWTEPPTARRIGF